MTNTKNTLIAQRYADALVQIARDGKLTFEKISKDLQKIIDERTDPWGINVISVEVKDVLIPAALEYIGMPASTTAGTDTRRRRS